MNMVVDVLSYFFAISGGLFVLIGTVGLFRLPDFPTRVHATGLADAFGIIQVLLAITLQYGFSVVSLKLGLVIILLLVTSPVAIHAIFQAYQQTYPTK